MRPGKPFRPDAKQTSSLIKAGRAAAIDARRDSKAHGLTVTFIQGNFIYEEYPDGRIERIGAVSKDELAVESLTKGMVLRAR